MRGKKLINAKVKEYLALKAEVKRANKAATDLLEAHIVPYAKEHPNEFTGNALKLDTGEIVMKANPPRIVTKYGEAVPKAERESIARFIPDGYRKETVAIDMGKVSENMRSDSKLRQYFDNKGVKIMNDTRYEVKPV